MINGQHSERFLVVLLLTVICIGGAFGTSSGGFLGWGDITIYYTSQPSGAVLYLDGQQVGVTPMRIQHSVSENNDYVGIKPVIARWASGEEAEAPTIVPGKEYSQSFTFIRPNSAGIEIDREAEIQSQLLSQRERQLQLQEKQLQLQEQQLRQQQQQQYQQPVQPYQRRSTNCTTRRSGLGDSLYTTCD